MSAKFDQIVGSTVSECPFRKRPYSLIRIEFGGIGGEPLQV